MTKKDSNDVSKTLKDSNKRGWEPFSYEKRISDAYKVEKKRKELDGSKLQSTTKRQKLNTLLHLRVDKSLNHQLESLL